MTLMQYLLSGNFSIESIKETNHTEEHGKWFILYQKKNANKVHHFVDNMLEQIFDNFVYDRNYYPKIYTPERARVSTTSFIGLYADALK
eukprot:2441396-Ditylum_brightwellii.AAC.1